MSEGYTLAVVAEIAERSFTYYMERSPETAVREAVTCIMQDLPKCGDVGVAFLKLLDAKELFRVMAESDDTHMWRLIALLKEEHDKQG